MMILNICSSWAKGPYIPLLLSRHSCCIPHRLCCSAVSSMYQLFSTFTPEQIRACYCVPVTEISLLNDRAAEMQLYKSESAAASCSSKSKPSLGLDWQGHGWQSRGWDSYTLLSSPRAWCNFGASNSKGTLENRRRCSGQLWWCLTSWKIQSKTVFSRECHSRQFPEAPVLFWYNMFVNPLFCPRTEQVPAELQGDAMLSFPLTSAVSSAAVNQDSTCKSVCLTPLKMLLWAS